MPRIVCLATTAVFLATAPGAIAQPQVSSAPRAAARANAPQAFSATIRGHALTSTNGQLADANVRLRDVRYGRIIAMMTTDKSGMFAFHVDDPGSYIVELVTADQTSVLAASEILNLDAGDTVSAVVKLPFRLSPFAGVLGGNVASATPASAAAVITQAAANSILIAATPLGAVDNCPVQKR